MEKTFKKVELANGGFRYFEYKNVGIVSYQWVRIGKARYDGLSSIEA